MRPCVRALVLICFAIFAAAAHGAVPVHQWSKGFGSTASDVAYGVAIDGSGNVIVTGGFSGTVSFGGAPLTSSSNLDVFVAKYDATGAHLWSKAFGGSFIDNGRAVAVDSNGNVIITGDFSTSIDFGGGPLTGVGTTDGFLAKLDPNGAHLWSKRFGGTTNTQDFGRGVAVDFADNIILTAQYTAGTDFGGGPLPFAGVEDAAIAKFSPSGAHLWSKGFGGSGNERPNSCAVDPSGAIAITGFMSSAVDFGGGPLVFGGGADIFIAKYDAAGNHQWSRGAGGTAIEGGESVTFDASGALVVCGVVASTADFGGGPITPSGGSDIFIARYDGAGAHQWSQVFGASGNDVGRALTVTPAGDVVMAGYFSGSVNFGGGPLTSVGSTDAFLLGLDVNGAYQWSQAFGSSGFEDSGGVALDATGRLAFAGADAGPISFGGPTLTYSGGMSDAFLAVFHLDIPVATTFTAFAATSRNGVAVVDWSLATDAELTSFSLYRSDGTSQVLVATGDPRTTRSYVDRTVQPGKTYRYEMLVRSVDGDEFRSPVAATTIPGIVSSLEQNHPNPFNPQTTISFSVAQRANVRLAVYDVNGALVRTLANETRAAGTYKLDWNGRDASGRAVASGVYFYKLNAGSFTQTKKMVLLK